MTICVAVCVYDGIVFGADSATSIGGSPLPDGRVIITNVYNHGNKVFNLRKGLPICAMTAGMGHIGAVPIHALAKDLRRLLTVPGSDFWLDDNRYTIEEIASKAHRFFADRYGAVPAVDRSAGPFSFWIGGISAASEAPELWQIRIADGAVQDPEIACAPGDHGVWVDGQPEPIYRLLQGFDDSLWNGLVGAGVPPDDLPQIKERIVPHTIRRLHDRLMPIQSAIDLVDYLIDVTKGYYKFLPGADTVGGDTDLAVVTRHENFKWIRRKHFYTPHLNPRETDHVGEGRR